MTERRSTALAIMAALCVTACAAAAPQGSPKGVAAKSEPHRVSRVVPLKNAGFENAARPGERCPEHWGCTMHNDPDAFVFRLETAQAAEGKQHLCVERVRNEPWALATVGLHDPALRGAKARFSIAIRIDRAEGAGAGPWVLVHGPLGSLSHQERVVASTQGWERFSIDFDIAPAAQIVEVGAILQGGGRACLDDARLEILSR